MKKLINRIQLNLLKTYLRKFPVVAIIGARQTGKTTLVRNLLDQKRAFFTLDDPAILLVANQNPQSFLEQAPYITIDEVQRCPSLLLEIKRIVDQKRIPGQFIITGSSNIMMLPKISETLSGRIAFIELEPLTIYEIYSTSLNTPKAIEIITSKTGNACWKILTDLKITKLPLEKILFNGGYPTAWLEANDSLRQEWFRSYIRTYLERDVRDLSRIQKLFEYQKFLALTAFRSAQILERSNLAKDAGIPYTTAGHFFDLLIATFQLFLLPPYFRNIGKRLIKSPKLIWNDTGIASYLQGITSWQEAIRLGRDSFLMENKIALELKTLLSVYLPSSKLFYWRTSAGAEVDILIENNNRLVPIEVKWREEVSLKDIVGLENFLKDFKNSAYFGIVLYRGKQLLKLKENIFLVPFECFL
ncbi:MAG: ATP-binding protein [Candidatus Omnitrophota bacterium]